MKPKKIDMLIIALCIYALFVSSISVVYVFLMEEPKKAIVDIKVTNINDLKAESESGKELNVEVNNEEYILNQRLNQMSIDIKSIGSISNNKEYFIEYKKIIEKYSDISTPVSIYNVFSEEEIYLMQRTIETECYQGDFNSKVNVASVIINRIESGKYGDTVEDIIKSPNQFTYHREEISSDTILALEYAYMIGDTTNGCVAFRSDELPHVWGEWTLQFVDDIGHGFYL